MDTSYNQASLCPTCTVNQSADSEQDDICVICLEELGDQDGRLKWPSCTHIFHRSCLETWRKNQVTCPTCRAEDPELAAGRGSEEERVIYATILMPLREASLGQSLLGTSPTGAHEWGNYMSLEDELADLSHLGRFFAAREHDYQNRRDFQQVTRQTSGSSSRSVGYSIRL